jgi:23S rRNA (guanosine2251-2'-O)-methyltransferase
VADRPSIVFGIHAVRAVLERRIGTVRSAVMLEGRLGGQLAELASMLEAAGVPIERAHRSALDRLARGGVHQGIVVRAPPPGIADLNTLEDLVAEKGESLRLLILDQVEDPRNLGACLRTADAAGVDAVVVPKARSAALSDVALKASAGAAETVPLVVVPNLARGLRWLTDAGVRLVGTDEQGESELFDTDLGSPIGIVLGAEGKGLRRLTREACDALVRIPMLGSVESLNVSVAAGVMLYEALRQSNMGSQPGL